MSNGDSRQVMSSDRPQLSKASLTDVEAWCERADLPLPPGPGSGRDILRIGESLFATWQPQASAYDFAALMAEACAEGVE